MEDETFCIPNIGKKQRQMRFWFGVIFLVIGLTLAIPMVVNGYPPMARLLLFIPFFMSMIGIFQAQGKT
jgi:hypothetical protein